MNFRLLDGTLTYMLICKIMMLTCNFNIYVDMQLFMLTTNLLMLKCYICNEWQPSLVSIIYINKKQYTFYIDKTLKRRSINSKVRLLWAFVAAEQENLRFQRLWNTASFFYISMSQVGNTCTYYIECKNIALKSILRFTYVYVSCMSI